MNNNYIVIDWKLSLGITKIKSSINNMENKFSGWVLDNFVSPDAGLMQGDLIRFDGSQDPLRKVGIVVTADCDLELKKHARLITLIPVVPVKVLMENYLLPEDCEKKRKDIENYAFRKFSIERDQESEAMKAILREKIATLNLEIENSAMIAAKIAIDELDVISVIEYKELMAAMGLNVKKADSISQQIKSRGDLLILPEAKKLGIDGDIAWVRHIWQIPLANIAIRTSEVIFKEGEKIARLDSPFRYRLTQLMAQVFSDIGLPNLSDSISVSIQEVYDNV